MSNMFAFSSFNQNLDDWKPKNLKEIGDMYDHCFAPKPYWYDFSKKMERLKVIESFHLYNKINNKTKYKKN